MSHCFLLLSCCKSTSCEEGGEGSQPWVSRRAFTWEEGGGGSFNERQENNEEEEEEVVGRSFKCGWRFFSRYSSGVIKNEGPLLNDHAVGQVLGVVFEEFGSGSRTVGQLQLLQVLQLD